MLLPFLVTEGLFLDGLVYATVSRNMADGHGNFLQPLFEANMQVPFYEHPPLVFWLQSLFFRIFGDHFYTEKIYCLCMALLSIRGIRANWKLLYKNSSGAAYSFLPVILWICIPSVHWSYQNNMLECTMSVFVLWSTWFSIKSIETGKTEFIFPAALSIWLAFLSKGPVALFPLCTPVLYALLIKKQRIGNVLLPGLLLPLFTACFGVIHLILLPELNISLSRYLNQQLFPSMQNMREVTTGSHFTILYYLLRELLLPVVLVLLAALGARRLKLLPQPRIFIFLLLCGLSASLPLMLTLKQRSFYLLPSLPYYAMALACICLPHVQALMQKRYSTPIQALMTLTAFPILITVLVMRWGTIGRDKELVQDIHLVTRYMKPGTVGNLDSELCSDWSVFAYSMRMGYVSWTCGSGEPWYMSKQNQIPHTQAALKPVQAPFKIMQLYQVPR